VFKEIRAGQDSDIIERKRTRYLGLIWVLSRFLKPLSDICVTTTAHGKKLLLDALDKAMSLGREDGVGVFAIVCVAQVRGIKREKGAASQRAVLVYCAFPAFLVEKITILASLMVPAVQACLPHNLRNRCVLSDVGSFE